MNQNATGTATMAGKIESADSSMLSPPVAHNPKTASHHGNIAGIFPPGLVAESGKNTAIRMTNVGVTTSAAYLRIRKYRMVALVVNQNANGPQKMKNTNGNTR
jgi:hypothetical protein